MSNHGQQCETCGGDHEATFLHCRACVGAKIPSGAHKVVRHAEQLEIYCATCGLPVGTMNIGSGDQQPMAYPGGLPKDMTLLGKVS